MKAEVDAPSLGTPCRPVPPTSLPAAPCGAATTMPYPAMHRPASDGIWGSDHFGVLADRAAHPYRDSSGDAPVGSEPAVK